MDSLGAETKDSSGQLYLLVFETKEGNIEESSEPWDSIQRLILVVNSAN